MGGTDRILVAALGSMAAVLVVMPHFIAMMKRRAWGQEIRPEGPQDHLSKKGTPTMGGLVILLGLVAPFLLAERVTPHLAVVALLAAANGALGLIDDLLKVAKRRNLGFKARQKLIGQIALGFALGAYLTSWSGLYTGPRDLPTLIAVWLFTAFVHVSITNAVNLTDGLDGLAGGAGAAAIAAFGFIAWRAGLPELSLASAALVGACLGFLWFNCYPARIFMGDTGSLALGGALAALSVLTRTEWYLVLIGGVFVAEALSVVLQVLYFKSTKGKRIFKMSPLHHHFTVDTRESAEDRPHLLRSPNWHEVQTSTRFTLAALALAAAGVMMYYRQ